MNATTLTLLGLRAGVPVRLTQGEGAVELTAELDDAVPAGCVRVAAGHPLTVSLGPMFGAIAASPVVAVERKVG
jgi:NADH-quinone oxidoreductase subunit G